MHPQGLTHLLSNTIEENEQEFIGVLLRSLKYQTKDILIFNSCLLLESLSVFLFT